MKDNFKQEVLKMEQEKLALRTELDRMKNEFNKTKKKVKLCEEIMDQIGKCVSRLNLQDTSRCSSPMSAAYTYNNDLTNSIDNIRNNIFHNSLNFVCAVVGEHYYYY